MIKKLFSKLVVKIEGLGAKMSFISNFWAIFTENLEFCMEKEKKTLLS